MYIFAIEIQLNIVYSKNSYRKQSKQKEREENTMEERIKELEEKLNEVCGTYEDDCTKCPYCKECEEYAELCRNGQ